MHLIFKIINKAYVAEFKSNQKDETFNQEFKMHILTFLDFILETLTIENTTVLLEGIQLLLIEVILYQNKKC